MYIYRLYIEIPDMPICGIYDLHTDRFRYYIFRNITISLVFLASCLWIISQ